MSQTFTKLFSSITESTVWCESHATRIVWITMLAMADRRGRVSASVPGLANRARVTLEECEKALDRFLSPDRYSRTPDNDGRRIEAMDGGWRLLNYAKYREMRDQEARLEYQREWDRKNRGHSDNPTNPTKSDQTRPGTTKAEAEAEEDKESTTLSGKPDDARLILEFLNEKTGKQFQPVKANLEKIKARLKEGATPDDLRAVVARKYREWKGTEMDKYLRPATLFNAEKFAQYRGELEKVTP